MQSVQILKWLHDLHVRNCIIEHRICGNMARVQKPCSMHVLHLHISSCLELVWIILLSLAWVTGSLALHTTPFLVAIYKCRMLPWVKITYGMGGTLGLVMCMILTVSTSLSTSHWVSAHTLSTCIHICSYICPVTKNWTPAKIVPPVQIFWSWLHRIQRRLM